MTFIDLIPHCMLACHVEHDREVETEGRPYITNDFYYHRKQAVAEMATRYQEALQAARMLEETEKELDACWPNLKELLSFLHVC